MLKGLESKMNISNGVDIVNCERIVRLYEMQGAKFLGRILSQFEIEKFHTLGTKLQIAYLSKRFAGKEAVSKALGCGIAGGLEFKDISILNDEAGKPYVVFAKEKHSKLNELSLDISLSDDWPFAVAFVTITR